MRTIENTTLDYWFERDRAYVGLLDKETDEVIVEWWDEAVAEAIDDGYLSDDAFVLGRCLYPERLHASAVEYANEMGL